jgi:hypothetical protein
LPGLREKAIKERGYKGASMASVGLPEIRNSKFEIRNPVQGCPHLLFSPLFIVLSKRIGVELS